MAMNKNTKKPAKKKGTRKKKTNQNKFLANFSFKRTLLQISYWSVLCFLWLTLAMTGYIAYIALKMPQASNWAIPKRPPSVRILDCHNHLIADRGPTGGRALSLKQMSPWLPKAVIAIEDRRFYNHYGIDPIGITRALVQNIFLHRNKQGGSTLTQQLAKNLFLSPKRTLERKIQEALLALWLEHKYTKEQILELYLNRVYLGGGAFGVEAAAHRYFNKSAKDINLEEAATIAGLLKAPSYYSPLHNPKIAQNRANVVLTAMFNQHMINENDIKRATEKKTSTPPSFYSNAGNYVADEVLSQLPFLIGAWDKDIIVHTTIDRNLEKQAQNILRNQVKNNIDKNVSQAALVSIDTDGAIRTLVGGLYYDESSFNHATSAKRQPGSAFKVFVYLAALEAGYQPSSVMLDAPIKIGNWAPHNFGNSYKGEVTLEKALSHSLNSVAVRLIMNIGIDNVIEVAHRLGIYSGLDKNASIALGTSEVNLKELTDAFVPLSNGGFRPELHMIDSITDSQGHRLYKFHPLNAERVIEPKIVGMINKMLQKTIKKGTAKKAILSHPAAGKTGTTQDFKDAWFIGYTAHYVTGVWFGNDDGKPMKNITGGTLPAQAWKEYMENVEGNLPAHNLPEVYPASTDLDSQSEKNEDLSGEDNP